MPRRSRLLLHSQRCASFSQCGFFCFLIFFFGPDPGSFCNRSRELHRRIGVPAKQYSVHAKTTEYDKKKKKKEACNKKNHSAKVPGERASLIYKRSRQQRGGGERASVGQPMRKGARSRPPARSAPPPLPNSRNGRREGPPLPRNQSEERSERASWTTSRSAGPPLGVRATGPEGGVSGTPGEVKRERGREGEGWGREPDNGGREEGAPRQL